MQCCLRLQLILLRACTLLPDACLLPGYHSHLPPLRTLRVPGFCIVLTLNPAQTMPAAQQQQQPSSSGAASHAPERAPQQTNKQTPTHRIPSHPTVPVAIGSAGADTAGDMQAYNPHRSRRCLPALLCPTPGGLPAAISPAIMRTHRHAAPAAGWGAGKDELCCAARLPPQAAACLQKGGDTRSSIRCQASCSFQTCLAERVRSRTTGR